MFDSSGHLGSAPSEYHFYFGVIVDLTIVVATVYFIGPGCSSVGDGLLTELGPFRVSSSGNLRFNKHSWNRGTHFQVTTKLILAHLCQIGDLSNSSTSIVQSISLLTFRKLEYA